jgi:hypothetical protein
MNEDRLNKLALSKGVPAAEASALKAEARSRMRPIRVSAEGLLGSDRKHLLVQGTRSFAGVAKGAVFYDPVMDEVALVVPQDGQAWIRVGPLEAPEILKGVRGPWPRVLRSAIEFASGAPDAGVEVVSHWLVRRIAEGVLLALQHTDVDGAQDSIVHQEPEAIWRALGAAWVVQPWGIPLPPYALGGLV